MWGLSVPPKYQLPRDPVFLPPRQQNDNPGILLICQIRFRRYLRSGAQLQEEPRAMAKRHCTVSLTGRGTCDGHESLGHRVLLSDGKNWRAHFFSVSGGLVQMLLLCVILSILATSTVALLSNISGASVGVGHTCAFNTSGSAFCWGYNYYGQVLSCSDRSLLVFKSCMPQNRSRFYDIMRPDFLAADRR